MTVIAFEAHLGEEWRVLGRIGEADTCGSAQSLEPEGREMILFGWINGASGVWRSIAGVDATLFSERLVTTIGLKLLADLTQGEYERVMITAAGPVRSRWRLEDE